MTDAEKIERAERLLGEALGIIASLKAGGAPCAPAERETVPDDLIEVQEGMRVAKMAKSTFYEFLNLHPELIWKRGGKKIFISKKELNETLYERIQFRTHSDWQAALTESNVAGKENRTDGATGTAPAGN
jgi:hypothetical protein